MSKVQFGVLAALLTAILVVEIAPHVAPQSMANRWEYRVNVIPDSTFLDRIDAWGDAGWDLVFARRALDGGTASYEVIMKRPI